MTSQVVQFTELTDRDRQAMPAIGEGDRIELHIRHRDGDEQTLTLSPAAAAVVETVLTHLRRGERVAVLTDEQELSPNEAAAILGMSRPLVVHRMDVGDLPFRYVGSHRRARLKDVMALKVGFEAQQAAQDALAADTEDLMSGHAL